MTLAHDCRGRCEMSTSMADSERGIVEGERVENHSHDSNGSPEVAEEITEEHTDNGDISEPIFNDGHLSYVGQEAYVIPLSLIKDYARRTRRLDLSFNILRSLDGLDSFINLEELMLDNNEIDDDVVLPSLQKLNTLTLNKNKITDLDRLIEAIRVQFPSLTYLSVLGNVACPNQLSSTDKDEEDYQRYRYYVLYHLPKLKFLDSSQVKTQEVKEAERVGPFMKVVRPDDNSRGAVTEATSTELPYSPLPSSKRQDGQHIGTYGVCKYVYYGRHSEGNRFIKNTDL